MRRCGRIALVVGTVLSLVNQGDQLVRGELAAEFAVKIPLNFAVPFVVASLGYVSARRAGRR
ncbi:MAG: nitrate/nitrite transporter NrtS [Actinomycetota bacterium]